MYRKRLLTTNATGRNSAVSLIGAGLVLILVLTVLTPGCTRPNPAFCDQQRVCPVTMRCNLSTSTCEPFGNRDAGIRHIDAGVSTEGATASLPVLSGAGSSTGGSLHLISNIGGAPTISVSKGTTLTLESTLSIGGTPQ